MLRLNKLTDYAVVILGHMARDPGRLNAARLAGATRVNEPTVAKILKDLTRAGLATATRGMAGGYTLARPAQDITVRAIIEAIEGPIALTECIEGAGLTCAAAGCGMRGNWDKVNEAIVQALESVTLAQMSAIKKPAFYTIAPAGDDLQGNTHGRNA